MVTKCVKSGKCSKCGTDFCADCAYVMLRCARETVEARHNPSPFDVHGTTALERYEKQRAGLIPPLRKKYRIHLKSLPEPFYSRASKHKCSDNYGTTDKARMGYLLEEHLVTLSRGWP